MLRLNDRLEAICSCVPAGGVVADIGSDHGFLPVALYERGISAAVIVSDAKTGPLDRARENISRLAPGAAFDFRLGDGLEVLGRGEADTVIIAGMGGLLIQRLISADLDKALSVRRFVLQPRNAPDALRRWLCGNGFRLVDERLAREGRFICEIMAAVPAGARIGASRGPEGGGADAGPEGGGSHAAGDGGWPAGGGAGAAGDGCRLAGGGADAGPEGGGSDAAGDGGWPAGGGSGAAGDGGRPAGSGADAGRAADPRYRQIEAALSECGLEFEISPLLLYKGDPLALPFILKKIRIEEKIAQELMDAGAKAGPRLEELSARLEALKKAARLAGG
ncbi:MAG: class I SAM-dependent methyltransferase [Clostridiales Family XIII bacterium]|jgi:tRNA A22 N-methylase|nr:class I SAM-dependent methyltransferase [Clostridiales Family XIII bacterium]